MKKPPKKQRTQSAVKMDLRTPKYRTRVAKSGEERAEQKDAWSKKAKHKSPVIEESFRPETLAEFYQVGDKVEIVKGPLRKVLDRAEALAKKKKGEDPQDEPEVKKKKEEHAVVRDPHGPAGTLGITVDGEFHLIDEEDVELIFEGVDFEDLKEWSYAENNSGVRVPISTEEQAVLSKCEPRISKSDLDDRDQEVARRMVSRGVLHRRKDDKGIYFTTGKQKLTRF